MVPKFTWDPVKAATNFKEHKVTFDDAITIFRDKAALFEIDKDHDDRRTVIGTAATLRVLFVVHIEFEDPPSTIVRIISARKANREERKLYEEHRHLFE